MTFLEEVKEELYNLRVKKSCCMKSELRGIFAFGGMPFDGNLIYGTDSLALAKRVSSFLRKCCNIDYTERLDESAESYKFLIPEDILNQLGLQAEDSVTLATDEENNVCCMRAFIRGAFLSSGSAASPEKAYRVEIFSENELITDKAHRILISLGVDAKLTKRKNLFVVYTTSSESAADMLKVAESSSGVFKLLDAKVIKDKRNESNRISNCDIANIDRANANSEREIHAIHIIEKHIGLDNLKPKLKEAALIRLENPGDSISELCQLFEPPLPKSTLNNRLNKLIAIANEIDQ